MALKFDKLWHLIRHRGITKKELAKQSGVSVSTLSRMEKEDYAIKFSTVDKICIALDCDWQDIVDFSKRK